MATDKKKEEASEPVKAGSKKVSSSTAAPAKAKAARPKTTRAKTAATKAKAKPKSPQASAQDVAAEDPNSSAQTKDAADKKTRSKAKKGAETPSEKARIRIKLQSFEPRIVDRSVRSIIEAAKKTGALIRGPIPMPVRKERTTVLISPHKHKDARDQYEIRTYTRILDILPTAKTMDALRHLDLSAGVEVKQKEFHDRRKH